MGKEKLSIWLVALEINFYAPNWEISRGSISWYTLQRSNVVKYLVYQLTKSYFSFEMVNGNINCRKTFAIQGIPKVVAHTQTLDSGE